MPTLKDIQLKISAVKKTRQITKAMNMVATSRLRGAQVNMEAFRPYAAKFAEVLGGLAENCDGEANPLLVPREEIKKIHVVLLTSDRGLCGGFNSNLISTADDFVKERSAKGMDISFTAFGKKGRNWCRQSGFNIEGEYLDVVGGKVPFSLAKTSGSQMVERFSKGDYDEVHMVYARFISIGRQVPEVKQILPIPSLVDENNMAAPDDKEGAGYLAEHIYEPSQQELLGGLLPSNVHVQLHSALLETSTSEHAARMAAMDNATKACNDMIDNLTLIYNKARQSAITADLMDIVGGAEALKG